MVETVSLKPCPFCAQPMFVREGVNSYARCDTEGCWMHERAATVPFADTRQVAQFNTRASEAHTPRVAEAVREACAEAMDELGFFTDVEELMHMTKQDMSVKTCEEGAAAIRALDIGRIVEGVGRAE